MAENPNRERFEKLGILEWHRQGYDGAIGLSATAEALVDNDLTHGWWESPLTNEKGSDHALKTALTFHQVAPGRKLVTLPPKHARFSEYVIKNGVDTLFQSLFDDGMDNWKAPTPYLVFCNSAGNGGEKSYNPATRNPFIWGIGALRISTLMPTTYSSHNPYIDFAVPDGTNIPSSTGAFYPFSGTSSAAPVVAGMAALVNHFFIEKTGKPLTREMMHQFLKDHSIDVWEPGKDNRTGYGMPVLPHPDDIDIERYKGSGDNMKFSDTKGHWAEKVIDEITNMRIMAGYPAGDFRPDKPMTRAEMAQVAKNIINFVEGMK